MDFLPTLGEKWLHSRGNVGKYSLHAAFGKFSGSIQNQFLDFVFFFIWVQNSVAGAWKRAKELGLSKIPSYQGAKKLPPGFDHHILVATA